MCYNADEHALEFMKMSGKYNALIPAWYLDQHEPRGVTTSDLHFPYCGPQYYGLANVHPEYSITYTKCVALNNVVINIGSSTQNTPSMIKTLLKYYHIYLLLSDPEHPERLPDIRGCNQ